MAFVLSQEPKTFVQEFLVNEPTEKGQVKRSMKLRFNIVPEKVLNETAQAAGFEDPVQSDIDTFKKIVNGWPEGQIKDDNGENIEPSDAAIEALAQVSFLRYPAIKAYLAAMRGDKPRLGN